MSATKASADFAIITALKVERDAIIARLESYEKIQEDDDPHTYYVGSISIPKSDTRYGIVLAMLLGMGNDEAAVTTSWLMKRWNPRNIVMVGIAGGVRGRINLGDVAVAESCFYYEPAKLTPNGEQNRQQQFLSDRMLLGRAKAYEASEWKSDIHVVRPGSSEGVIPEAHFGPIGSGEKVVADEKVLSRLLDMSPKMIAVAMEGAGVARAAATSHAPPRFLEVRGICDFADSVKNDDWHAYAADAAASFIIGFLRSRPVSPVMTEINSDSGEGHPLLVLRAQSLRTIAADEIFEAFSGEWKSRDIEAVGLDLTDLVRADRFAEPQTGVTRLLDENGSLMNALTKSGDHEFVFHGLAHIPFVILSGHLITDRQPVHLFDFHPTSNPPTWKWPENSTDFPPLVCKGLPSGKIRRSGEVVVRISISYRADSHQTRAVVGNAAIEIDLSVPTPQRGIVQSEEQVRTYGKQIREVLDAIVEKMPGCPRIHIFYAGPVAMAFHLGQQISPNIHPPVIAWNFRQGKYEWAIDLAAALKGEPSIVEPDARN